MITCMPRQIPKNGILFSLAYFIARILPSIPRIPNPPGTTIPSADLVAINKEEEEERGGGGRRRKRKRKRDEEEEEEMEGGRRR